MTGCRFGPIVKTNAPAALREAFTASYSDRLKPSAMMIAIPREAIVGSSPRASGVKSNWERPFALRPWFGRPAFVGVGAPAFSDTAWARSREMSQRRSTMRL